MYSSFCQSMKCDDKSRRQLEEWWKISIYCTLHGEVVSKAERAVPWMLFGLFVYWGFFWLVEVSICDNVLFRYLAWGKSCWGPTSGALGCLGGGCRSCENWCPLRGQVTVPADVGGISNLLSSKLVLLNMGEVWRVALLCWQPLMPCLLRRVPCPSCSED